MTRRAVRLPGHRRRGLPARPVRAARPFGDGGIPLPRHPRRRRSRPSCAGPTTAADRGKVEPDNYNHAVLVGLRYALFQPPPPPAPVPAPAVEAPAPARTYLVFFDWDRADLTGRAREIIARSGAESPAVPRRRGSRWPAMPTVRHAAPTTSACRSAAPMRSRPSWSPAASPATRSRVSAYGESRPLVPTADGVREPQNRRVEIVLR